MRGAGRRRRRRGRFLRASQFLEPALAFLLHNRASHGYTLLEQLKEFGLGDLDTGMVYRALRGMEDKGWIVSTWDTEQTQGPPRRVYSLTTAGDQMLRACVHDLQGTRQQLDSFLSAYQHHMAEGEGEFHGG